MRIQGRSNWSILDASEYSKAPKGSRASNFKSDITEGQDSVSISKIRYESYRKNISEIGKGNTQSFQEVVQLKQSFPSNVVIDIEGFHHYQMFDEARELDRIEQENLSETKEKWTLEKKANNLLKTYTRMYDEIVKGYADGTREVWISDPSNGEAGHYRRLTQEEELQALDKAYENHTQELVNAINMKEQVYANLEEVRRKVASAKKMKIEDKKLSVEQLPPNALKKMTEAAQAFRERYKGINNDNKTWDEIVSKVQIRF